MKKVHFVHIYIETHMKGCRIMKPKDRLKRFILIVLEILWNSFCSLSVIVTIISFSSTNLSDLFKNNLYLLLYGYILILLIYSILYWFTKHVDPRIQKVSFFPTGDIFYYIKKNRKLEHGTFIQIMRIFNNTSIPYAIGIVDTIDEHNKLVMVKKVISLETSTELMRGDNSCKDFYYLPYLREVKLSSLLTEEEK